MLRNADDFDFVAPRSLPFVEPRSRGELPHLFKDGCSLFVTFRLWDAVVPSEEKERWQRMTQLDFAKMNAREIAELHEPRLKLGSCVLADECVARLVQDAIRHFDNTRYLLFAWCLMPNHVHIVFTPKSPCRPEEILHSWKSYTSHEINRLLKRRGTLWERESFDHLIRSAEAMEGFIEYTSGILSRPDSAHAPKIGNGVATTSARIQVWAVRLCQSDSPELWCGRASRLHQKESMDRQSVQARRPHHNSKHHIPAFNASRCRAKCSARTSV